MHHSTPPPPDARLLIASGCVHCPVVLDAMAELVKRGAVGRLEVVNIAFHPDAAQAAGTRTVPWLRLGPFEFSGALGRAELAEWAARAAAGGGHAEYLQHLLETQRLAAATQLAREDPAWLHALLDLASDLDTPMGVRIGVGAVFEDLGPAPLQPLLERLSALGDADAVQLRADAAHYLGLVGEGSRGALEKLVRDPDPEVAEIARDSLDALA